MDLSIIIPVYNVQEYINECVNSVLNIADIEYEIIIINDGSTDNSRNLLMNYQGVNNVIIIDQVNRGLSYSRNVGLQHAHGKYIFFLDADDCISTDEFRGLLEHIPQNYDIISGNYLKLYSDSLELDDNHAIKSNALYTGEQIIVDYYLKTLTSVVWRNLYKRSYLIENDFFFTEGIYHEDLEWMPKVYYNAQTVLLTNIAFYYYRQREGSIVHSTFNEKKFADRLYVSEELLNYSKTFPRNVRRCFASAAFHTMIKGLANNCKNLSNMDIYRVRQICRMTPYTNLGYFIVGLLCLMSPALISKILHIK